MDERHDPRLRGRAAGLRLALASAVLALAVPVATPARAQIVDCAGLSAVSGYKVLLDDLVFAGEGAPSASLEPVMDRLRFRLETALQALRLDPQTRLKVLRCAGRKPRGEADFDSSLVRVLDSREVVLEVWGSVVPREGGGAAPGCEALIGYALIPVRSREGGAGAVPGVFEAMYESDLTSPASRLLDLFKDAPELPAFSALSVGVDQLEARQYDLARSSLCRAEILLAQRRPAGDPLVAHAGRLAREVVTAARRDSGYNGILRAPQVGGCRAPR